MDLFDSVVSRLPPVASSIENGAQGRGGYYHLSASRGQFAHHDDTPQQPDALWSGGDMDERFMAASKLFPSVAAGSDHDAEAVAMEGLDGVAAASIDMEIHSSRAQARKQQRMSATATSGSSAKAHSPIVGVGVAQALDPAPAEADPVVGSLRQERNAWRLARSVFTEFLPAQLHLYAQLPAKAVTGVPAAPGAPSSSSPWHPYGALPASDGAAQDGRIAAQVTSGHHGEAAVLGMIIRWLEESGSDDVMVKEPVAAGVGASMGIGGGDDDDPLAPLHPMWASTSSSLPHGCHPDALFQSGAARQTASLSPADQQVETHLYSSVWQLIRTGRRTDAQLLCARYGQPWLGALLSGMDRYQDEADEDGDDVGEGGALLRRGNPNRHLYKRAASAAADQVASSPSSASNDLTTHLRRGILLHAGGRTGELAGDPMVCGTLEDRLWAAATGGLEAIVSSHIDAHRQRQAAGAASGIAIMAAPAPGSGIAAVMNVLRRSAAGAAPAASPSPSSSGYASIIEGLIGIAQAVLPVTGGPTEPDYVMSPAYPPMAGALQRLLASLHSILGQLPLPYQAAVAANGSQTSGFSPIGADAMDDATRQQVPASSVPLLRFAVHLIHYLRHASPLSRHTSLLASPATDDLTVAYARHLASARPNPSAHAEALLELCSSNRMVSQHRGVRVMVAVLLSMPMVAQHASPSAGGYASLLMQQAMAVAATSDRAAMVAAAADLPADHPGRAVFLSAARHVVLLQLLLDGATVTDLAASTSSAASSPSPSDALAAIHLPSPALPQSAKRAGISLFDITRLSSIQWLISYASAAVDGATGQLRPDGRQAVIDAVAAANLLSRLLVDEAGQLSQAASAASNAPTARSAIVCLHLLWAGLGELVDPGNHDGLAQPVITQQILEVLMEQQQQDADVSIALEAQSWRAYSAVLKSSDAWAEMLRQPMPREEDYGGRGGGAAGAGGRGSGFSGAGAASSTLLQQDADRVRGMLARVASEQARRAVDASEAMQTTLLAALKLQVDASTGAVLSHWLPGDDGAMLLHADTDPLVTDVSRAVAQAVPDAGAIRASLRTKMALYLLEARVRTALYVASSLALLSDTIRPALEVWAQASLEAATALVGGDGEELEALVGADRQAVAATKEYLTSAVQTLLAQ